MQNQIYSILKQAIQDYHGTWLKLTAMYELIEEKDRMLRSFLDGPEGYGDFYVAISRLLEENLLQPVKNSAYNSGTPALKLKYRIVKDKIDYSKVKKEIAYTFQKPLSMDYYMQHPTDYIEDKSIIKIFQAFFKRTPLPSLVSVNERSYELFGSEKFLKDGNTEVHLRKGAEVLKHLGLGYEDLHCYLTYEPFFYIAKKNFGHKGIRSSLIVENQDTFWSFNKLLFEQQNTLGIDMLIYGQGNKISNSFQFLEHLGYTGQDTILYFGDIDPAGIDIFMRVYYSYGGAYCIKPFIDGYCQLIDLSAHSPLQKYKEKQNLHSENIEAFCAFFEDGYAQAIRSIINDGLYIPQEALHLAQLQARYGK